MQNIFGDEKFLVANFKQSGDLKSLNNWIDTFKTLISDVDLKINLVLCPSFPFLNLFHEKIILDKKINQGKIFLGSQNLSSESNLENTGEVGAESLKDFVNFSIIGHSERKENYDLVLRKYQNCINNKIIPIVCFYENKRVFELDNCLFAFEDPKAISKEGIFREKTFDEVVSIKKELESLFGDKTLLYGGSLNSANIQTILDLNFFRGFLVGRSSMDPNELVAIIKKLNK